MRGSIVDAILFATDRLRVAVLTLALLGILQTARAVLADRDQPPPSAASVARAPLKS
jgi:hypothetical protein